MAKSKKKYSKKTKRSYEVGGTLNQNQNTGNIVGQGLGTALSLAGIPGLAPILGQLGSMVGKKSDQIQTINNNLNQLNTSVNPYQFEHGGQLEGMEGLLTYEGPSHTNNGIAVNEQGLPTPTAQNEVEGEETVLRVGNNAYVFSKKLKI